MPELRHARVKGANHCGIPLPLPTDARLSRARESAGSCGWGMFYIVPQARESARFGGTMHLAKVPSNTFNRPAFSKQVTNLRVERLRYVPQRNNCRITLA